MGNDTTARVRYFSQQFLRTQDFTDEQSYHVKMRRRHNIANHIWGIVNGLKITSEPDGLFVQPGVAIDGYGREIVLTNRAQIAQSEFSRNNSNSIDVWIVYSRKSTKYSFSGAFICQSRNTQEYNRWSETPAIRVEKYEIGKNSREPKSVSVDDLDFKAHNSPPDDPVNDWPVFLGSIHIIPETDPIQYLIDTTGRPNAGLVGDNVLSPSGRAMMFISEERSSDDVPSSGISSLKVKFREDSDQWVNHLSIKNNGETDFFGSTRIHGDLAINKGALQFKQLVSQDASEIEDCDDGADTSLSTEGAWGIYKHVCKRKVGVGAESDELIRQLRIEMVPESTIPGAKSEVVIGSWSPDEKKFMPILTVGETSSDTSSYGVTVHGDLIVKGGITQDFEPPLPKLSAEAKNYLTGTFASGISGANTQLPTFYDNPTQTGECDITVEENREKIITQLENADADVLNDFIDKMVAKFKNFFIDEFLTDQDLFKDFINAAIGRDGTRADLVPLIVGDTQARRETIDLLVAEDDYVEQFVVATLDDNTAVNTMVQKIVENGPTREHAINLLITDPGYLNEINTETLNRPDARDDVIEDYLANGDAREKIIEKIIENVSFVGQFANLAKLDKDAREIIIDILLENDDSRQRIIEVLMDTNNNYLNELIDVNNDSLEILIDKILQNNDSSEYLTSRVIEDETTRGNLIVAITSQAEYLAKLMEFIIDDPDATTSVVKALLGEGEGLEKVIDEIIKDHEEDGMLDALINRVTEYTEGDDYPARTLVINEMVADGLALPMLVDNILEYNVPDDGDPDTHEVGIDCIITNLEKSEAHRNSFAAALNENTVVKEALCPPP